MRMLVMDFAADGAAAGARSAGPDAACRRCAAARATAPAPAPTTPVRARGRLQHALRDHALRFRPGLPIRVSAAQAAPTSLPLADLTRGGWSNTAGQQRSTLQRVSYALVDDVLKRSYTTALDTVQGTKPVVQDLLDRREDHSVPLSRQQSDLAKPVAARSICRPSELCGRVRWPWKSPSNSRTGARSAALIEVAG